MMSSTHLDTRLYSTHSYSCYILNLHCTLCPYCNPSHYSWYLFGVGCYSGTSHHVTTDLVALTLHALYTTSDSVIIGDGLSLLIANMGSFSLTSLHTPLFFFSNVLHVHAMSKNLIMVSVICVDNPINVLFFYFFF